MNVIMDKRRNNRKIELLMEIGMFLSILIVGYICGCKVNFPGSTTDELAYLSQAARYAGMGNRELMQYYPFYGQGISLIWSLLFRLFPENFIIVYRLIIFFNSFFLAISFLVSYYCGKILYPLWNRLSLLMACYLIILYPCNIYYMQMAETENLLWLLFWISFYLFIKTVYSHKWIYSLLYSISISFMLIVHYRTIVILLVSCLMFVFLLYKKEIQWYDLIIFLCGIGGGYFVFIMLKHGHFAYIGVMNELTTVNVDFSYLDLIRERISELGKYIIGCSCKLYYFITVGSIAVLSWLIVVIAYLKDSIIKKSVKLDPVMIFQFLMLGSHLFAFASPLPNLLVRYDHAIYARYIENIMGPILLSGVWFLLDQKENIKVRLPIYFAFMECIMLFVYQIMDLSTAHMFAIDSAVGIGALIGFWPTHKEILNGLCKSFLFSGLILLIYLNIYKKKNRKIKEILSTSVFVMLFVYWGYLGIGANVCNYNERNQIKSIYYDLAKVIGEMDSKHIIYIRDKERQPTCIEGKYLHWALGNEYLFNVMDYDEIGNEKNRDNVVYVASKNSNIGRLSELGGMKYYENSKMEVYTIQN